jgi:hypothetical protein
MDAALCSLIDRYQWFRGICFLHLQRQYCYTKDIGIRFLRNVGTCLSNHMVSHPRRLILILTGLEASHLVGSYMLTYEGRHLWYLLWHYYVIDLHIFVWFADLCSTVFHIIGNEHSKCITLYLYFSESDTVLIWLLFWHIPTLSYEIEGWAVLAPYCNTLECSCSEVALSRLGDNMTLYVMIGKR